MPTPQLDVTLSRAPPDLTLVTRRDGIIISSVGGHDLGVAPQSGALPVKTLMEMWNEPIAAELRKLILRTQKSHAEVRHQFLHNGRRVEVRLQRQGIDRVLLMFRVVVDEPAGLRVAEVTGRKVASKDVAGEGFKQRLADAVANAGLRESRFALAVIHLGELSELEAAFGIVLGNQLIAVAIERVMGVEPAACCSAVEPNVLAVLLEDIPGQDAAGSTAERIRRALVQEIALVGRFCSLAPTIGVALYPGDGRESQALFESARSIALEVQRSGRTNTVAFCSDTMPVREFSRPDLERELRWAVDQEQFELLYLPIVELAGRRVEGFEAALRWPHPLRGPVPPEQFRPMLEAIDMQTPLDRWALGKACLSLAELTRQGNTRQRVSVNLSRQFIDSESMPSYIDAAMAASGLSPTRLTIDIDMRSLLGPGRTRERLRELRKRGVHVFLDEFGPDGAPLARLARLPIDGLKISPAFVARLEHDASARAVCSSIIAIAKAFGLRSLAPGVETRAQLDFLLESKCDQAQGPLFQVTRRPASPPAG